MKQTLARDVARCAGRFDFEPDGRWCEMRDSCQRYLAFVHWDRELALESYQGIPVFMAHEPCEMRIPANEVADG